MRKKESNRLRVGKWLILAGVFELIQFSYIAAVGFLSVILGIVNLCTGKRLGKRIRSEAGCALISLTGAAASVAGVWLNISNLFTAAPAHLLLSAVRLVFAAASFLCNIFVIKKVYMERKMFCHICLNCQNKVYLGDKACSWCGAPLSWKDGVLSDGSVDTEPAGKA